MVKEILNCLFGKRKTRTLGEAWQESKKALLTNRDLCRVLLDHNADKLSSYRGSRRKLVEDHAYLYNLLGDPSISLSVPKGSIILKLPRTAREGEEITITGKVKGLKQGQLIISVECSWNQFLERLKKVDLRKEDAEQLMLVRYRKASRKIICQQKTAFQQGSFSLQLVLPHGIRPGQLLVKAYAWNQSKDAAAFATIRLIKTKHKKE